MALGALEFYGDLHYSIISLLSPFVMLRLSYFVDHLQKDPPRKKEKNSSLFKEKKEKVFLKFSEKYKQIRRNSCYIAFFREKIPPEKQKTVF
jgi:5-methylthioribose kinase